MDIEKFLQVVGAKISWGHTQNCPTCNPYREGKGAQWQLESHFFYDCHAILSCLDNLQWWRQSASPREFKALPALTRTLPVTRACFLRACAAAGGAITIRIISNTVDKTTVVTRENWTTVCFPSFYPPKQTFAKLLLLAQLKTSAAQNVLRD